MTHKLTLENPPEGYEATAEYIDTALMEYGDAYFRADGTIGHYLSGHRLVGVVIRLTPKKKTFWRLDRVATFEEATKSPADPIDCAYGRREIDGLIAYWVYCTQVDIQWLKLTEHSELLDPKDAQIAQLKERIAALEMERSTLRGIVNRLINVANGRKPEDFGDGGKER